MPAHRTIGLRASQSRESGIHTLDFLLCSFSFFPQTLDDSRQVSHWFSLGPRSYQNLVLRNSSGYRFPSQYFSDSLTMRPRPCLTNELISPQPWWAQCTQRPGFLRFITLLVLLVLALTACISIAAKQQPPSEVLASSSLDNIEKLLSKGEIAGMAISIVKNGRVQRTKSFGWPNAALKTQIGNDTIFEVASLSKPVVAYGVLQLVDRRLIGIDDPASKYIDSPELRDDSRWKTLTIMMLLDYTSGLPNELRPGEKLSFSFTPGTRFSYSGIGFLFLQQIVEKVTRLSFEQYLETAIFKPLHMTSTSFVWRDDYDTRKANGHDNIGRPTAIRKPMVPKAPSSLHTSAADYARFLAAVLGRSGLSASRWKAMVTPQIPVQQDCVVCISKAAGQLSSAVECKRVRKYTVDEILDSL